ncbi:MAG: RNA methyltransferase [Elusimicrobiota bacterium]
MINKLKNKKERDELGLFIVEGIKCVNEAIASGWTIETLVFEKGFDENRILYGKEDLRAKKFFVPIDGIQRIQTVKTWPGVMAVVRQKRYALTDITDGTVIIALENVADPGNLGTIIRTCDWFGVKNIMLSENSVDVYNEKTVRGTMGSIFRTRVYESITIMEDIAKMKKNGYSVYALTLDGEDVKETKLASKNSIYLFGNESTGLTEYVVEKADKKYKISGGGNRIDSLNLAVSVGVVLNNIINLKS